MVLLGAYGLNAIFNLAIGLLVARFLGPAEFGRFALALALAAVAQLLVFDWLRLSALRFAPASASSGGAAASLNLAFAMLAGAGGALALIGRLSGRGPPCLSDQGPEGRRAGVKRVAS